MTTVATQSTASRPLRLDLTERFGAPPEKVYAAFVSPEAVPHWFGGQGYRVTSATIDARTGGRYRFDVRSPENETYTVAGTYLEVVPNRRLVFTWAWLSSGPDAAAMRVTVEFIGDGEGTLLRLTHEMFPDTGNRDNHAKGWAASFERLAVHLAA